LNRGPELLATAKEMVAADPQNMVGLYWVATFTLSNSSPEQLDAGQRAAQGLLANVEDVFAPAKKPATVTEDGWRKERANIEVLAHSVLGWVAYSRQENEAAAMEFKTALELNPMNGQVSYWLGSALLRKAETQGEGLYHIARAAVLDGQGALDPNARSQLQAYLQKVYALHHGDSSGLDELKAVARYSAFPPANFKIKTAADIATKYKGATYSGGSTPPADAVNLPLAPPAASPGTTSAGSPSPATANVAELAALKRLGERRRIDFSLQRMPRPQRVGDIALELTRTDPGRQIYTVHILVDDKRIEKRNEAVNQAVQFYVAKVRQPYELVVTRVGRDSVEGYLSVPRLPQLPQAAEKRPIQPTPDKGQHETFRPSGETQANAQEMSPQNLIQAASRGDTTALQAQLAAGADPNSVDNSYVEGWTALMAALEHGHAAVVEALVRAGADVNARNGFGATALDIALANGQTKMAEVLRKVGGKGRGSTQAGSSLSQGQELPPLHKAVSVGDTEEFNRLLESGENVNATDRGGITALHWAAAKGRFDMARRLITKGADVNVATVDGDTPLHFAAAACNLGTVIDIFDERGQPNMFGDKIKSVDYSPYPGQLEFVEELLRRGANVNASNSSGMTPLASVIALGYLKRAEISVAGTKADDKTSHVVSAAFVDLVRLLLRSGANVNIQFEPEHQTPLILAVKSNRPDLVRILLASGARIMDRDTKGHTALDYAETPEISAMLKAATAKVPEASTPKPAPKKK